MMTMEKNERIIGKFDCYVRSSQRDIYLLSGMYHDCLC